MFDPAAEEPRICTELEELLQVLFLQGILQGLQGTLQLLDFMVDSTVGRTQIPDETDPDSRSGGPNFPLEILQLSGDS